MELILNRHELYGLMRPWWCLHQNFRKSNVFLPLAVLIIFRGLLFLPNGARKFASSVSVVHDRGEGTIMSKTNKSNLESRFDDGEDVLDYFDTNIVLNIKRLTELSKILNLSAVAREAGINIQTLQSKIRRRTALSGDEVRRITEVLKKFHLQT